jgi:hypothetical protein
VLSEVLAAETSARAPDGRTGNYRSHTMLVFFPKNQGLWQMNYESVAHISLLASEEYVDFIPTED